MPAYDAMPAMVSVVGLEEVHRAALALGAAGGFSKQFRHRRPGRHAHRQAVAVAGVAVDQVILALLKQRCNPPCDRFLPAIHITDPADALTGPLVFLNG